MKTKKLYYSPDIALAEVDIESGIAVSGNWYNTEENGTNINWGYGADNETWG